MRRPIRRTLAMPGADQVRDFGVHQLAAHRFKRRPHQIAVLVHEHLLDDLLDRHPLDTGHRWRLLSSHREKSDDHRRHGGRNRVPSDPVSHHATGRDQPSACSRRQRNPRND